MGEGTVYGSQRCHKANGDTVALIETFLRSCGGVCVSGGRDSVIFVLFVNLSVCDRLVLSVHAGHTVTMREMKTFWLLLSRLAKAF